MKPAITKTKKPAIPAAIERAIAREIDEHKAEKAALIAEQAALIAEKAALQAAFDERTAQYEKERAERELQLAAFKKQPEIEQQPEPAAAAVQDTGARARDHRARRRCSAGLGHPFGYVHTANAHRGK